MEHRDSKIGIIYALSAYFLWGFLPIYWKLVDQVSADQVLAHRIVWSFFFMIGIVIFTKKWSPFIQECKIIVKDKKKLIGITAASVIISLNWLTFIWAVNNGHVIQASLGYYINPLISILLGIIILKERVTRRQAFSIVVAGIAVINLTFSFGVFPWISLLLAFSFALYGLLKKMVDISAIFGLTIETMIVTPVAAIYLLAISDGAVTFNSFVSPTTFLLIGSGIATAIPLLLFGSAVKHIPLSIVGFLQYIAPTIMLILGVFLYEETFSRAHFISFALIWVALIIFMGSIQRGPTRKRKHSA